jgi:hypothetical protein
MANFIACAGCARLLQISQSGKNRARNSSGSSDPGQNDSNNEPLLFCPRSRRWRFFQLMKLWINAGNVVPLPLWAFRLAVGATVEAHNITSSAYNSPINHLAQKAG